MKMKIPSSNSMGNGYYGYGDTYLSDGTGSESVTPANSNSIDDCDSPSVDGDFSEYLWMENEEEFDKQVMQQLEEEALMEQCIEAMLEDELAHQEASQWANAANNTTTSELCNQMNGMKVAGDSVELAKSSKLNPLAAEFVPSVRPSTGSGTQTPTTPS